MTAARSFRTVLLACALFALSACGGGGGGGGTATPAAGFELRLGSASIGALQGSEGLLRVQVQRKQGFAGAIEVGLANPPAGVSAGTVVVEAGEEARLPLRVAADVAAGPLMLTISAVGGGVTLTANLEVNVGAAQPRSQVLIQAALDAGQIDYGTSLLYRAYAMFGDARLPPEFVGSGPVEEDNGLFDDIERDRAALAAALLDQLAPFLLRPDDPQSFFNAGRPTHRERPAALPANDQCSGATREWITARSTQHPVRVWTLCEGTPASNQIARANLLKVIDVVDKAYGAMVALMKPAVPDEYGDDAIDVYIVPPNADAPRQRGDYAVEGVRGVAIKQRPFAGRTSSGYNMLPTWRLAEPDYQLTVIHELFHILQFAYNYTIGTAWWFGEASATWASFHFNRTAPVRPPDNSDLHLERFGGYQESSDGLLSLADDHAYKSYIWPFFMEQQGGAELVGGVWKQAVSATTAEQANNVLDFLFPFKDNFRGFGLRNLNKPYLPGDALPRNQRYVGLDSVFPDQKLPSDGKRKSTPIVVGTAASLKHDKPIEPLAAVYFEAKVENAAVKKVVFDLGGMNVAGVDVAALVKIDGTWESQPRDLNGKSELKFCLDRPAEKLEEIVFIVGNYRKEAGATVTATLGVKGFAEPCGLVWAGTVSSRWLRSDALSTFELNTTVQVTFEFDDTVEPHPGEVPYRLRNGSYTLDGLSDIFGRNPPCRATQTGSGAMLPEPRGVYNPLKVGSTSANLMLFTGDDPQQYVASVGTAADTTTVDNCNDRGVDETTRGPSTMAFWMMAGPQPVSADGKTIAGTYLQDSGAGGNVTWTWQLTLQDE